MRLSNCITRSDNSTIDPAKVATVIGLVVYVTMQGYALWLGQPFDANGFATGFATIVGSGSYSVWLLSRTRRRYVHQKEDEQQRKD